jgi:hypothetical protein
MRHRHLTHQTFTLAAIDDVIDRGRKDDWLELRRAALSDPSTLARIRKICAAHLTDPYAQRYHFWMHYAERSVA